MKKCYLFKKFY